MSFSGKLVSIEPNGRRSRAASGKPDESYSIWKITVESDDGQIYTANSGRQDMLDRWRALIGTKVKVLQGGKERIVGGVIALLMALVVLAGCQPPKHISGVPGNGCNKAVILVPPGCWAKITPDGRGTEVRCLDGNVVTYRCKGEE